MTLLLSITMILAEEQTMDLGRQKLLNLKEILPLKVADIISTSDNTTVEQVKVTGLENALLVVKNPIARERLLTNLQKWQKDYQYKYEEFVVLENGMEQTVIVAKNKGKLFGLIPITFQDQYTLHPNGELLEAKRSILSKLFNKRK